MVQIAGNVTMDGVPVDEGTIGFFPVDGKGASAEDLIDAGRYTIAMPPGEKKVVIRGFKKVGEHFPWGKNAPAAAILEEIVPADFNAESQLTVEVAASRDDLDFLLATP